MKLKKTFASLFIVIFIINIISFSLISPSAVTKTTSPRLDLVRGTNGYNVVWNKVNSIKKYRLYFGVNDKWRCYTDLLSKDITTHPKYLQSVQFLIERNSLTGRHWAGYGEEKGVYTYNINTNNTYKCQIEALNSRNQHITWSNVGYVVIGKPSLKATSQSSNVKLKWSAVKGANHYQIAYRKSKNEKYTYKTTGNTTENTIQSLGKNASSYSFQVRPFFTKYGRTAYGTWSNVATIPVKTVTSKPVLYEENTTLGSFTAKAINLYNIPISGGVSQYTIDNYQIGLYTHSIYPFNGDSIALFGHSNKAFGNIRYLKPGNIVTITAGGKAINYQVYYKGVCRKSSDYTYYIDNSTGANIMPFMDNGSDLYMITCHEYLYNNVYAIKAKRL